MPDDRSNFSINLKTIGGRNPLSEAIGPLNQITLGGLASPIQPAAPQPSASFTITPLTGDINNWAINPRHGDLKLLVEVTGRKLDASTVPHDDRRGFQFRLSTDFLRIDLGRPVSGRDGLPGAESLGVGKPISWEPVIETELPSVGEGILQLLDIGLSVRVSRGPISNVSTLPGGVRHCMLFSAALRAKPGEAAVREFYLDSLAMMILRGWPAIFASTLKFGFDVFGPYLREPLERLMDILIESPMQRIHRWLWEEPQRKNDISIGLLRNSEEGIGQFETWLWLRGLRVEWGFFKMQYAPAHPDGFEFYKSDIPSEAELEAFGRYLLMRAQGPEKPSWFDLVPFYLEEALPEKKKEEPHWKQQLKSDEEECPWYLISLLPPYS